MSVQRETDLPNEDLKSPGNRIRDVCSSIPLMISIDS